MQIATALIPWAEGVPVADPVTEGKEEKKKRRKDPPDELSRLLIEWMVTQRRELDWDQTVLAEKSGVNRVSIVHMEKGRQVMSTAHLMAFAAAFGMSLRKLLTTIKAFHDELDEAGKLPLPPLGVPKPKSKNYAPIGAKGGVVKKPPAERRLPSASGTKSRSRET
jgi:DNA-binding XRE family transcriptional regulator